MMTPCRETRPPNQSCALLIREGGLRSSLASTCTIKTSGESGGTNMRNEGQGSPPCHVPARVPSDCVSISWRRSLAKARMWSAGDAPDPGAGPAATRSKGHAPDVSVFVANEARDSPMTEERLRRSLAMACGVPSRKSRDTSGNANHHRTLGRAGARKLHLVEVDSGARSFVFDGGGDGDWSHPLHKLPKDFDR